MPLDIDDLPVLISDAEQDAIEVVNEYGAEDAVNLLLILGQLDAVELVDPPKGEMVDASWRWTREQQALIAKAQAKLKQWQDS